jgi:hypothetical protein
MRKAPRRGRDDALLVIADLKDSGEKRKNQYENLKKEGKIKFYI